MSYKATNTYGKQYGIFFPPNPVRTTQFLNDAMYFPRYSVLTGGSRRRNNVLETSVVNIISTSTSRSVASIPYTNHKKFSIIETINIDSYEDIFVC